MAGFFDPTDPTAGGLMNAFAPSNGMPGMMGMLANPQTAGMLGMAGGLLQAAGPSRLPVTMGQAMGAGLSGMGQGVGNAFQTQQQLLRMRAMQGLMGGDVGQSGAQPQSAPSYSSMFGPASTAPGTMAAAAPQAPTAPQPDSPGIYGRSPQQLFQQGMLMNMAGIQGGGDMMRIAVEHDPSLAAMMPTDITKMGMQGGMTPDEIQAANRAGVTKANYIAPTALRTPIYFNPQTGKTEVVPADQLAQGYGAMYGAEARAQAGYKPMQVWDPNANGGQGGYVYQTTTQVSDAANGGLGNVPTGGLAGIFAQQETNGGKTDPSNPFQVQRATFNRFAQPGESWDNVADRNAVAQRMLTKFNQDYGGDLGRIATAYFSGEGNVAPPGSPMPFLRNVADSNGKTFASYVGDILGRSGGMTQGQQHAPMAAQPPLGQGQFAQGQVQQMQQRWGALRDQNANAQTVISQLQNISSLAPAAITGAEADKRAYVNGLLSLVGIPGAQDAKTATDLLGKYSNQIVAKLGQGGLGTDAARSIVEAGNPNAHMTVPAIQEAVRNLQGQYQMVQAKTNLLQQFANGNNPAAYSKAETVFDQNADPRIWEYQSIQDPVARQQFAHSVLKQDPKFGQKIQALEKLGAL